jgi:hypothetical protein
MAVEGSVHGRGESGAVGVGASTGNVTSHLAPFLFYSLA